jgi:hypothetical protein
VVGQDASVVLDLPLAAVRHHSVDLPCQEVHLLSVTMIGPWILRFPAAGLSRRRL